MAAHWFNPYDRLAPFYDALAAVLLAPFGGEAAFRGHALDALGLPPGAHVLELGCGTGAMTQLMLARGLVVTAVDLSRPMLARARRRARGARFLRRDVLAFNGGGTFDAALLSFVLHEMDAATRRAALHSARRALRPGGRVGVLEFARPPALPVRAALHAWLRISEPATALDVVRGGLERSLAEAGLRPTHGYRLALGAARMVVAVPRE